MKAIKILTIFCLLSSIIFSKDTLLEKRKQLLNNYIIKENSLYDMVATAAIMGKWNIVKNTISPSNPLGLNPREIEQEIDLNILIETMLIPNIVKPNGNDITASEKTKILNKIKKELLTGFNSASEKNITMFLDYENNLIKIKGVSNLPTDRKFLRAYYKNDPRQYRKYYASINDETVPEMQVNYTMPYKMYKTFKEANKCAELFLGLTGTESYSDSIIDAFYFAKHNAVDNGVSYFRIETAFDHLLTLPLKKACVPSGNGKVWYMSPKDINGIKGVHNIRDNYETGMYIQAVYRDKVEMISPTNTATIKKLTGEDQFLKIMNVNQSQYSDLKAGKQDFLTYSLFGLYDEADRVYNNLSITNNNQLTVDTFDHWSLSPVANEEIIFPLEYGRKNKTNDTGEIDRKKDINGLRIISHTDLNSTLAPIVKYSLPLNKYVDFLMPRCYTFSNLYTEAEMEQEFLKPFGCLVVDDSYNIIDKQYSVVVPNYCANGTINGYTCSGTTP
ncbi:hypothetical protein HOK00_08440 [bacterium]|nr:hypothetical protein [bacterium]